MLGLSDREFFKLTPARLAALVDAYREKTKLEDYRADVIVTVMRKVVGDKKAEMWDFFPQHKVGKTAKAVTNAADVRANMKAYIEYQNSKGS